MTTRRLAASVSLTVALALGLVSYGASAFDDAEQATIDSLQADVSSLQDRVDRLEQLTDAQADHLVTLDAAVSSLADQLDGAHTLISEQDVRIDALQDTVFSLRADLSLVVPPEEAMTSHRAGAIATAVVSAVLGLAAIGYVAGAFNATEAATIKAMKARITATEQVNAAQQLQLDDLQAQLDAAKAAPFSFSNITATVGADAVVIEWDVTPCATGQVMYGTTTAYGKVTPLEPALLCHHRQRITGLVPGTTYHYAVVATDGAGARTVVQVA